MAFIKFFFCFWKSWKKLKKWATTHDFLVKNRECNTERGFKNQLYIELGFYINPKLWIYTELKVKNKLLNATTMASPESKIFNSLKNLQDLQVMLWYRTRAIMSRGLYIFYPIFKDHFFVFKEVFSENSVLMYGLYSRAACN